MKTKKTLIYLLIICPITIFSQNNIEGMYYNYYMQTFEIRKDSFSLTIPNDYMVVKGKVKQISFDLLELNSIEKNIQENMRIVQSIKGDLTDSIRIRFHIPSRNDLMIKIPLIRQSRMNDNLFLHYRKNNSEEIVVSREDGQLVYFYIREDNIAPHDLLTGVFYGRLEVILAVTEKIKAETDNIDIYIPDIDDMYFDRYQVVSEYARISGDTISFKGEKYIKNKDDWSDWNED